VLCCVLVASLAAAFALDGRWFAPRPPLFAAAQVLAVAAALGVLLAFPALRLRLTPKGIRYAHAHANAVKQFLARNIHITAARTGVLVFVSLAERYAEIIADSGINAYVPQSAWDEIVRDLVVHARRDCLTEGYVAAIRAVGALLARHFPPPADNRSELDDHLIEI